VTEMAIFANARWRTAAILKIALFTEFTEATRANDDTDGISRHRLSPYTA